LVVQRDGEHRRVVIAGAKFHIGELEELISRPPPCQEFQVYPLALGARFNRHRAPAQ